MDPLFSALSYFRRRKYEECVNICTELLKKNPYDQAVWCLKTRALTEQVYVDDIEAEEEGIAEVFLDNDSISTFAKPGTSLKTPGTSHGGPTQAYRPVSRSGRPLSGMVRPGTNANRPSTMEQALLIPRTAKTARPATTSSGRYVRLGTASMVSQQDGPFINMSRLNLGKYATQPNVARALFEYLLYHENDTQHALDLACQSSQASQYKDWWWTMQIGKCYYRLGLPRDADKYLRVSLHLQPMVPTFLYLVKVGIRLDQPLAALEVCHMGLELFSNEVMLLTAMARIQEALSNITLSVKFYKDVLHQDAMNIEAIACIGMQHFYTDQPEVALRYYRRLLQMGVHNAELFNNLGLCCFYSQQYDMTLTCFERALALATDDIVAEIWYNIAHLAIGLGDLNLATQCLWLTLVTDNSHPEAYNNLGVLESRKGHLDQGQAYFQAACAQAGNMFEPQFNYALLSEKVGDLQTSYVVVQKALDAFPNHVDSKELLRQLQKHFISV